MEKKTLKQRIKENPGLKQDVYKRQPVSSIMQNLQHRIEH